MLNGEKKYRTEMEEEMAAMMKEMVAKSRAEVAVEKKEREKAEDVLLSLIENTCARLSPTN
jgi:hypothetical protein